LKIYLFNSKTSSILFFPRNHSFKICFSTYRRRRMENDPKRIYGKAIADDIRKNVKEEVEKLKKEKGITPGLAVVLVGERKDSQTYVRMKRLASEECGIRFFLSELPASISQEELLENVKRLNANQEIHGLIVQLPLPEHIKEIEILNAVSYEKDVDGLHPMNIGDLAMKGRTPRFVPGTPRGCLELLDRIGVNLDGKNVVVLGRSNIVGIPVALLCLERNATVTICHSKTKDITEKTKQADILISAVGKPMMVKKEWIKPGAIVIDVGTNNIPDSSKKSGYRMVGDVDYDDVREVASKITPVPGGVGPMTVAMLLLNTLTSAKRI